VRRAGDIALLVLQWALVLLGVYGLSVSSYLYLTAPDEVYPTLRSTPAEDVFMIDPRFMILVQGVTFSLTALGVGGILFYLRRLYLSRRQ
jgi:hypothetical protein